MIRIVITDDHALIREGLMQVIQPEIDMEVVGDVGDGAATLELLRQQSCDVLVLDIHLPGRSGLDILQEVQEFSPETQVLFLSMHPEERYALRCMKAGAAGYITKSEAPDEIVTAIRKIHRGGKYISEALALELLREVNQETEGAPHTSLSNREFEVFQRIANGQSTADIARELFLSASTINTHRAHILEKLHLSSNAEIIKYAYRHGLIEPD